MTPTSVLRVRSPRAPVGAVVLVLHGGRADSTAPVHSWSAPVLRMQPFAWALWRAGNPRDASATLSGARPGGLAVARLRFAVQGWNGERRSPVADAQGALRQLRNRFPGRPIGLVGHSMGARTALAVADDPAVRSVVALAPWIEDLDQVEPITGRVLLIAHGANDRITSPAQSLAFAERARGLAAQASYVRVAGDGHAMLRRARLWHQLAAGFTVGALFGTAASERRRTGTDQGAVTNVVTEALAGQPLLTV